jgi:hypothetical protein
MARKKRTASAVPPTASTTPATALSFSELHARLEFLQSQRQKILKLIKRKKTELTNFHEQMQAIAREMLHHGQPLYEQARQIDSEIHALFKEILTKRRLGKRSKREVKQIYQILQFSGRITPNFEDSFGQETGQEDFDEEMFGFDNEAEGDDFGQEDFFGQHGHSRQSAEQPPSDFDEVTAKRPSREVRKLFLKLADRFHPDKVTDEKIREHYTEIMKEINVAYKSGDLARLLEIEAQGANGEHQVGSSQNDQERECQRIETEIQLLSVQYEQLKAQVREVRNAPNGEIVKQYRKAKRAGEDPIAASVEDGKAEIESLKELRDFVQDFRDKKITLQQFLQGPSSMSPDSQEEMEELLDALFEDLVVVIRR